MITEFQHQISQELIPMDFEFEGIDELIREIDKIEGITEELKDQALIEGGDLLLDAMKEEVYNVLTPRSGKSPENMTRTDPENGELFVGIKGGAQQPSYYLYMQEVGFYNVWAGRFIAPKPFASIAFNKSINPILNAYVDVFRKGLDMR